MRLKLLVLSFLFCFSSISSAQTKSYIDSITNQINSLTKKEKVEVIVNIPFDKTLGEIKKFEVLADSAILWSNQLKDSLLLAQSFEKKALVLHFTTRTEETFSISLETIQLYEKLNMPLKVGDGYANLAWRIKYLDLDKALMYMRKGIDVLEKHFDAKIINPAYDNFGALFLLQKQMDSALFYHNKSLYLKKQLKDSVGIPFGYCHLAEVYYRTDRFNIAEKYLDSALTIREQRNDVYGISDTYLYFGDLYYEKEEYYKAINNYEEGFDLSKKGKYYPLQRYASEYLYKSYSKLNNYKEALEYHLLYTQLKDSILNVETNNKINQLEIEFQTEKKEKEILKQRAVVAEQGLTIQKRNNQLYTLIGLALLLVLIVYFVYNQQKIKNNQLKKDNELKEAILKIENHNKLQEQRLRISRDLHDNIGAQLTFIISSLDNLKYGFKLPNKLNNKLKGLSEFTSVTIRDLRDTIWAMNKSDIHFEELQARVSNFIDKANLAANSTQFNFEVEDSLTKLKFSSVVGMNIYRIIQEGINNSIKYAKASTISVNFKEVNGKLEVIISDDGAGFNIDSTGIGNGINNMRKRASDINSEFQINSDKVSGTTISLKLEKKNIR